jgi:hypothetical protein
MFLGNKERVELVNSTLCDAATYVQVVQEIKKRKNSQVKSLKGGLGENFSKFSAQPPEAHSKSKKRPPSIAYKKNPTT